MYTELTLNVPAARSFGWRDRKSRYARVRGVISTPSALPSAAKTRASSSDSGGTTETSNLSRRISARSARACGRVIRTRIAASVTGRVTSGTYNNLLKVALLHRPNEFFFDPAQRPHFEG